MKMAVARTGIKDVARLAGVSVATVSKVFNPSRTTNIRMSESTRRRVLEAAEQLDYTPNYGATLLRGHSSHTIGFSLSLPGEVGAMYMSDYPREILNGLGRAAEAGGYQILLIHGGDYRNYMDIERIDALVILGFRVVSNAWQAEMVDMFQRFNRRQYPYVVINNGCDTLPVPSINLDNRHGVKLIADLIRRKGYSSVGFIGELTTNPQSHLVEREKLLREFLAGSGIDCDESRFLSGARPGVPDLPRTGLYSHTDGMEAVRLLHRRGALPRCLVCGNDTIAQGVICAAAQLGIRIPEELAIIGFDDLLYSQFFNPPLTTVRQPYGEFGRLAYEYVIRKLDEPDYFAQIEIKPTLIERSTT